MNIGQRVITSDGSAGIIVSLYGNAARICYLTPNDRLSYIAANHLLSHLKPAPLRNSFIN
ncbi:MAG: hypothetical protein JWM78_3777 [Verrucomicrobiaceae bacterium]|nr:hypothetical protein [Verrucomicrobiaceae bacterium]